jgi:hypothetical protein
MVNGHWSMGRGEAFGPAIFVFFVNLSTRMLRPYRSMVICHWSLVIGQWSLVNGHWSLVNGHWSLVINDNLVIIFSTSVKINSLFKMVIIGT